MVYSDIVNGGLILPRAARYTIRHYKRLRKQGYSIARARFICHCSAIYHATYISKTLCNSNEWFTIAEYNGII